jgi:hypothetical protein
MLSLPKLADDDRNNEKNENCDDGDRNHPVCGHS